MVSTFLAWAELLLYFLLWQLKPFSPQWHESPLLFFSMSSSLSVQLLLSPLSLLPDLLPCLLTDLFSTAYLVILSTDDLLILILPVWSIFSSDTALGLVDALLSLDVLLLLFWRRSHWLRSFLQCFIECSFHNWGTWFHECLGYSWTCPVPGEGSYFSIILVILLPVPNDPVVVDSDVLSLILNSGLDSFCVSGLILCTVSIEAAEVSWSSVIVLSSSCIVSVWGVWVLLLQFHKHWND